MNESNTSSAKPYDREALVTEVCERLAMGEPMALICRDDHMPDRATVHRWAADDTRIAAQITQARALGFDAIADAILEIADDARNDYMEALDKEGAAVGWKFNRENVERSRLRAEARLKLLAKWDPKRYGDKQQIEHSGHITLEELVTGVARKAPDDQMDQRKTGA